MKKQFLAAGFLLFSLILPTKASATIFSQLYVFGDSLVDNGNFFSLTQDNLNIGIPPSPYFEGRFSNGPVWVEYLSDDLGLTATNFAVASATTGDINTFNNNPLLPFPGLTQQIDSFLATNPQADQDALYIISAGSNDYLGAGIQDFNQPVNNLLNVITNLASVGAKNFLVPNLFNLGSIPATQNTAIANELNILTGLHNLALSQSIQNLSQQRPSLNLNLFDVNSIFSQVINNPEEFPFTNLNDSCLEESIEFILATGQFTQCSNPNEYLFWDALHPTTTAHGILADAAFSAIEPQSVPESGNTWGLLALGALGAAGMIKQQQKKLASTLASLVIAAKSSHTVEN
ncbi:SGNH/GDSL hydrolase family protein [Nodularia harveyana UHCC-0300]|uniref:SGNH/GDSL hydrolase family protein n=1 Tax=Nodularia harveyana UHCC-0300 TaxID=2974287 RepID=A0ABU5UFN5_9CYAN|nr:SGNH/GDSL hydrolase family protein [Nodularia harveyana]MEA5582332.1 SGNH/GDSL hydrolase family protein [Nodularia harveyana UHCC-0300]